MEGCMCVLFGVFWGGSWLSLFVFKIGSYCVDQSSLKHVTIFLPQPPGYWGYRCTRAQQQCGSLYVSLTEAASLLNARPHDSGGKGERGSKQSPSVSPKPRDTLTCPVERALL